MHTKRGDSFLRSYHTLRYPSSIFSVVKRKVVSASDDSPRAIGIGVAHIKRTATASVDVSVGNDVCICCNVLIGYECT